MLYLNSVVRFRTAALILLAVPAAVTWADGGVPSKGLGCVPDATTLCLGGQRFAVTVDWEDAAMVSGQGQVFPVGGDNWGLFYYDDSRYLELLIKVLDGCGVNNFYWVFAAGLSNDDQTITVTDTTSGSIKSYLNTLGGYDVVITDTAAFPCGMPMSSGGENGPPKVNASLKGLPAPPEMTLVDGRFQIDVEWTDFSSNTGFATPVAVTSHSGYFWFFASFNPEMLVHIFDGSADNGYFHVFAAATTNVEYTIRVVDQCTGAMRSYHNPLGVAGAPAHDETAFLVGDPDCVLFADGFESGDTSKWTAVNGS